MFKARKFSITPKQEVLEDTGSVQDEKNRKFFTSQTQEVFKMTNNDKVRELTNGEFKNFIEKGTVAIDFFAQWCMPCLMMAPIFEEMSERFKGKIKFAKVNVDDNQELASKFKVMSIPTTIIFKEGKEVKRFIGAMQAEDLENKIKAVI